jgi:hypothetical protein
MVVFKNDSPILHHQYRDSSHLPGITGGVHELFLRKSFFHRRIHRALFLDWSAFFRIAVFQNVINTKPSINGREEHPQNLLNWERPSLSFNALKRLKISSAETLERVKSAFNS